MAAHSPTTRCYLLEIPKELRLEIFEYLVKPWKVMVRSVDSPTILTGLSEREIASTRFLASTHGKPLSVQLLRTCRPIHDEAKSLLLKPTTLVLAPAENLDDRCHYHESTFDIALLTTINQVSALRLELATRRATAAEDIAHSIIIAKHFVPDLCVKHLTLALYDFEDLSGKESEDRATRLVDLQKLLKIWKSMLRGGKGHLDLINMNANIETHWDWERTHDGVLQWREVASNEDEESRSGHSLSRPQAICELVKAALTPESEVA